jgi:hypothetical protein
MMRFNKLLPLLFIMVITLTSCGHSYKVNGTTSVSYMDGKTLFLKVLKNDQWVNVDSAEVIHGTFKMKGSIDSIMVASLYMDDQSLMPVVLESGSIKIDITDEDMKVSGTPLNEKLYDFIKKKNELDQKAQDLDHKSTQMIIQGVDESAINTQVGGEMAELSTQMNNFVKKFITDNYDNALGPSIFIMLCSNMPYPMMTPQIEEILKDAPDSFKNNVLVSEFISKAHENARLMMEQQRMEQNETVRSQQQGQSAQQGQGGGNGMQGGMQMPNQGAQQGGAQ